MTIPENIQHLAKEALDAKPASPQWHNYEARLNDIKNYVESVLKTMRGPRQKVSK